MKHLKMVDLNQPPRPIDWLVDSLLPMGHLSFFGAEAGTFKTATAVFLAVQMARPSGEGEFLGRPVVHGPVVYLNFDNVTGDAQGIRYWLDPALQAFPDADPSLIHVVEPQGHVCEATPEVLQETYELALVTGAKLVIWDSFESLFPGINILSTSDVRQTLFGLERMAADLGICCLTIDHLPKIMKGESPDQRGLKGNSSKKNAARAVHLFTLVDPEKTAGRYVYRWKQIKNSFAPPLAAFGVEVRRNREGLVLVETDLPDDSQDSKTDRAIEAVVAHLEAHPGQVVERRELIGLAQQVGLGLTRAKLAVDTAVSRVKAIKVTLPGRGGPVGYRFESPDAPIPTDRVTKIEKHDRDGVLFWSPPSDQNNSSDLNGSTDRESLTRRLLEAGAALGWKEDTLEHWRVWAADAPLETLERQVMSAEGRLAGKV